MQLQSATLSARIYLTLGFRGAYFSVDDSLVNVKFCFAPFRAGYVEMIMPAGLYVHRELERCRLLFTVVDTARVIAFARKASGTPHLV